MTVSWLLLMFTTPHHTLSPQTLTAFIRSLFPSLYLSTSLLLSIYLIPCNSQTLPSQSSTRASTFNPISLSHSFSYSHFLSFFCSVFGSLCFPNSENPELHGDGRRQGQSPRRSLPLQDFRFPQR